MKKVITFFAITFFAFSVSAQSVSYSVECITPDSCFLKEVSLGVPTEQDPRPQSITSYKFFRSIQEFDQIAATIRKQAADETKKAMEILDRARSMNGIADKIEAVRPKEKAKTRN